MPPIRRICQHLSPHRAPPPAGRPSVGQPSADPKIFGSGKNDPARPTEADVAFPSSALPGSCQTGTKSCRAGLVSHICFQFFQFFAKTLKHMFSIFFFLITLIIDDEYQ